MKPKYIKFVKCICGNPIPIDSEIYFNTIRLCSNKCFWKAKNSTGKEWNNRSYEKIILGKRTINPPTTLKKKYAMKLNKNGELDRFLEITQ